MNQTGFTIWFTGLPGAGKSTLARMLSERILRSGLSGELLDGDVFRNHLSQGLGYSREDRDINIKRIGYVCKLLTRNQVIVIVAAIAPYREARNHNREVIERYVEVYVKCPLETLIKRDPKGLYKRALAGEIPNFTGISDPYEEPLDPEILLETDKENPEESLNRVLKTLEILEYLKPIVKSYSSEEEEKIINRLKEFGYI